MRKHSLALFAASCPWLLQELQCTVIWSQCQSLRGYPACVASIAAIAQPGAKENDTERCLRLESISSADLSSLLQRNNLFRIGV